MTTPASFPTSPKSSPESQQIPKRHIGKFLFSTYKDFALTRVNISMTSVKGASHAERPQLAPNGNDCFSHAEIRFPK